jgi:hypothetical protein
MAARKRLSKEWTRPEIITVLTVAEAMLGLVARMTSAPWWGYLIALVLPVILVLAVILVERKMGVRGKTLSEVWDQIGAMNEAELEALRREAGLPEYSEKEGTPEKKLAFIRGKLPLTYLNSGRRPGTLMVMPALGLLVIAGAGVFLWWRHQPVPEEVAIRTFYSGITSGLAKQEQGWTIAYEQCSEERKGKLLARALNYYPDKKSLTPGEILKPLYDDSAAHTVLQVVPERRGDTESTFTVLYRENKNLRENPLCWAGRQSATAEEFYRQFSTFDHLHESVWQGLNKYYHMSSRKDLYKGNKTSWSSISRRTSGA